MCIILLKNIFCGVREALYCRSDLKLANNGSKGRWSSAAVLQQVHTSVVVADVSRKDQELCFSGQEDVCNPLAFLPEGRKKGWRRGSRPHTACNALWASLMCSLCGAIEVHVWMSVFLFNSFRQRMRLTSVGFDSPARWGFCGAGCKHQAAHWGSPKAFLHPTQAPPRPRLPPRPLLESPGIQKGEYGQGYVFCSLCSTLLTKVPISLKSPFLPLFFSPPVSFLYCSIPR